MVGSPSAVDEAWGGSICYFYHVGCLVPAGRIPKLAPMNAADIASDVPASGVGKAAVTSSYTAVKHRLLGFLPGVRVHLQAIVLDLFFVLVLTGLFFASYARLSPFAEILLGFCLVCGIAFWLSGATPGMRLLRADSPPDDRRPLLRG